MKTLGILEQYLLALNTYSYFSYHRIPEPPKVLIVVIHKKRSNLTFQPFIFTITHLYLCSVTLWGRLHQAKSPTYNFLYFKCTCYLRKFRLKQITVFSLSEFILLV